MNAPPPTPGPRLRDLVATERPQERLQRLGASALSDIELLAMLLRSGSRGNNVLVVAQRLILEAGTLAALVGWTESDYRRVKGIGRVKALQLLAVMEFARRILTHGGPVEIALNRPELVHQLFAAKVAGLPVEKFWVLCLNRRNRLLKQVEVTSGTATSSLVHPREVFREAVRLGATAVVCVHNHPSGDPSPSAADLQVTRQLRDAARIIDIELMDHVVIGRPEIDPHGLGYYSFRLAGVL
ncbi:MAG: DNA repair protein RadC [Opitutaceae bacterium]|nr:DNA repair protein RadC [Opitutaceae bacterium]